MGESTESLSRRAFLFHGVSIALARGILPPLEDLLPGITGGLGHIQPQMGESVPQDLLTELEKSLDRRRTVNHRGLFLTFDDGPLFCTGQILDLLAQTSHKVTFFVIGRNLQNRSLRRFAVRALQEGHDIGNHSYSHPDFSTISGHRAETEIRCTHAAIREVIAEAGVDPTRQDLFFRFPYGAAGNTSNRSVIEAVLDELGYGTAWWDIDPHDWRMDLGWFGRSPSSVISTLTKARSMDVVLLHDREKTAHYLPEMLRTIGSLKLVSIPLSDIEFGSQTAPSAGVTTVREGGHVKPEDELAEDLLDTISQGKRRMDSPATGF